MEAFGKEREAWLKQFPELLNGIPGSNTFRRLFKRIDPSELSNSLNKWLAVEWVERTVVVVVGKTIRGSGNATHWPCHVISAFAVENRPTRGEIVVDEKSSEITAVPELLDLIDVQGTIVTADASIGESKTSCIGAWTSSSERMFLMPEKITCR